MPFAAMPSVPMTGLESFITGFMLATKQNVELLTGQFGDTNLRAVVRGQIAVQPVNATFTNLSARGEGYNISGTGNVPTLEDYAELLKSVQLIANDLETVRQTLNALLTAMKA